MGCFMGSGIEITLQPRVVRVGQAHTYLGMCKDEFARAIRPFLTEVKIGTQGKGFDRVELDLVWEHYKSRNSCPPKHQLSDEPRQDRATVITSSKKSKGTPKSTASSGNAFDALLSSEKARLRSPNLSESTSTPANLAGD